MVKNRALFLTLLALYSGNVTAMQCWIVSGEAKDYTGAFNAARDLLQGLRTVGRTSCKVFGSWASLNEYYQSLSGPTALKSGEKILIYQGAHGGPGGSAATNCGDESGEFILQSLLKIAEKHPVGGLLGSCYSSDLQKGFLAHQNDHPSSPTGRNLCLLTNSPFARVGYATLDIQLNLSAAGKNLNQLYSEVKESFKGDAGPISSALPWNDLGVAEALTGKSKVQYLDFLNRLCRSPSLTCNPEVTQDLLRYRSTIEGLNSLSDDEFAWWYAYQAWRKRFPIPVFADEFWLRKVKQLFRPLSSKSIAELELRGGKQTPGSFPQLEDEKCRRALVDYAKERKKTWSFEELKTFLRAAMNGENGCPAISVERGNFLKPLAISGMEGFLLGLRLEQDFRNLTQKPVDLFNLSPGTAAQLFEKAAGSEDAIEPGERLVREMLGLESETLKKKNGSIVIHSAAHQALHAYAKSAVKIAPTDPKDRARWEACEGFVIE